MTLGSFLSFEKLITPTIIKAVYVIGLILILLGGVISFFTSLFAGAFGSALLTLLGTLVGLLAWRMYCELVIVLFGLYDRAGEIRDRLPIRP
jgi:hypothetical protein